MSAAPSAYPPVFAAACSQRVGVGSPGSSRAGRPAIVDTSAVALLGGTENMSSAVLRTEPSTQQTAIAHDETLSERHASKTGLIDTWPRGWWLPPGGRIPPSPRPIRPLNRFQRLHPTRAVHAKLAENAAQTHTHTAQGRFIVLINKGRRPLPPFHWPKHRAHEPPPTNLELQNSQTFSRSLSLSKRSSALQVS